MSGLTLGRVARVLPRVVVLAVLLAACTEASSAEPEVATAPASDITCIGQPCGEPCQYCDRQDPDCIQAQTGFCDGRGECKPPPVSCKPLEPGDDTTSAG